MSSDQVITYSKKCSQFQKTFTNIDWLQNSVHNLKKPSQTSIDHKTVFISLQKQIGCFNYWVVTLVAAEETVVMHVVYS